MDKKRIGIVTSVLDGRGARGTAGVARELLPLLLADDTFEFTLIHHEPSDDPLYKRYPTLTIPHLPFPFDRVMLREFIFWMHAPRFDVVHYLTPRVWPSYLATNARRIIVTPHDAGVMLPLYRHTLADKVFQYTNRFLHGRMDRVIAVSAYARDEIIKTYAISPARVVAVPNALPKHFIEGLAGDRSPIKGLPNSYILSVGRFDPHKNIVRLIEAYHQARSKGVEEPLVLAGGRHMPAYSDAVDRTIAKLHLEASVHIAPVIPDRELPSLYANARAVVYPSIHEGFGLPLLEAMACGTPVACADMTALPEIAGSAALLFDPLDVRAMSDAIVAIVKDTSLRAQLSSRGRARVKDFSWEKSAAQILALYRELTAC